MIELQIHTDIKSALQALDMGSKQVRFGAAHALTKTAQDVKAAELKEMLDVFDKPTRYTMNSLYVKPAKRNDLTARVWFKDHSSSGIAAADYISPHIKGGGRAMKPHEYMLRSIGALPDGYRAVPGEGAQIDSYGNMARGQIVQILAYFKAFGLSGFNANMSDKNRQAYGKRAGRGVGFAQMFIGRPGDGKLPLGIWQRVKFSSGGTAIKPLIIFVSHAQYGKIFDFHYVADKTISRVWPERLREGLAYANRTAR